MLKKTKISKREVVVPIVLAPAGTHSIDRHMKARGVLRIILRENAILYQKGIVT